MRKVNRAFGFVVLALGGGLGTTLLLRKRKRKRTVGRAKSARTQPVLDNWARPGMNVVFRAELMPGRNASERTFKVRELLKTGRVLLAGAAGEHTPNEFEPIKRVH